MAGTRLLFRWLTAIALVAICYLMLPAFSTIEGHPKIAPRAFDKDPFGAVENDTLTVLSDNLQVPTPPTHAELSKRVIDDDDWDNLVCFGEHIINIDDTPSYEAAKKYCENHAPAWIPKMRTDWENPAYQTTYGWSILGESNTIRNLHINRLRPMLQHYKLSTDPNEWLMRTARHSHRWTDSEGKEHDPSNGFFSFLVNKRTSRSTMIWTAMFSPQHMIDRNNLNTIEPPLRFASDLYYLNYYRYWAVDRQYEGANAAGGSQIPPPRTIVIRSIHETLIVDYFREIKRRQNDLSPRVGGRKWPGDRFTRDHEEFFVLMTTPMGQGVTWFLTQHKHIWGAKSVGRIRVWSTDDSQDDFNMLFEIIDPPPKDSDGEEAAGSDPPAADPPQRRDVVIRPTAALSTTSRAKVNPTSRTSLSRRDLRRWNRRRGLRRRALIPVDEATWNGWLCLGHGMYDLMSANDAAEAATIADKNPVLANWRGKTDTQFHNPQALSNYGWSVKHRAMAEMETINTDGMILKTGLSGDNDDWFEMDTQHIGYWKMDGTPGATNKDEKPTKATFNAHYLEDKDTPAFVMSLTVSPWYARPKGVEKVPPLQKLSDVIFLVYYDYWRKVGKFPGVVETGGSKIPPPKWIFIKDIQEDDAVDMYFPELGRRGGHEIPDGDPDDDTRYFGDWPGVTYTPGQDGFYALLATKQGRGISAFMFNHKQELGSRRIKSINIWFSGMDVSYYMRFELEDSPPPKPKAGPARRVNDQVFQADETIGVATIHRHDSFDLGMLDEGGAPPGLAREF